MRCPWKEQAWPRKKLRVSVVDLKDTNIIVTISWYLGQTGRQTDRQCESQKWELYSGTCTCIVGQRDGRVARLKRFACRSRKRYKCVNANTNFNGNVDRKAVPDMVTGRNLVVGCG